MPLNGSCLCGKVKVTIKDGGLPLKPVICRCTSCQTTAGSMYSLVSILPEEHVEIAGETKAFEDKNADSGNPLYRRFCGNCGTPIQSVTSSRDGNAIIKMGLFARSADAWGTDIDGPTAQIFTRNKKEWEPLVQGIPALKGMSE